MSGSPWLSSDSKRTWVQSKDAALGVRGPKLKRSELSGDCPAEGASVGASCARHSAVVERGFSSDLLVATECNRSAVGPPDASRGWADEKLQQHSFQPFLPEVLVPSCSSLANIPRARAAWSAGNPLAMVRRRSAGRKL